MTDTAEAPPVQCNIGGEVTAVNATPDGTLWADAPYVLWRFIAAHTERTTRDVERAWMRDDIHAARVRPMVFEDDKPRWALALGTRERVWLGWEWWHYYQPKRSIFRLLDFAQYVSIDYTSLLYEAEYGDGIPLWESRATRPTPYGEPVPIRYTKVCPKTRAIAREKDQLLLAPGEQWTPRTEYSRKSDVNGLFSDLA